MATEAWRASRSWAPPPTPGGALRAAGEVPVRRVPWHGWRQSGCWPQRILRRPTSLPGISPARESARQPRSEEHTSELQSLAYLVCRLLLEKKKKKRVRVVLSDPYCTCECAR